VNEHGELPLSYGRYVRYDDYDDHVQWLLGRIEKLEEEIAYLSDDSSIFHVDFGDEDRSPYSAFDD
jgi:hypothetical protein